MPGWRFQAACVKEAVRPSSLRSCAVGDLAQAIAIPGLAGWPDKPSGRAAPRKRPGHRRFGR
jgi:hypothetical protein